jgi:hypothetical protein
MFHLSGLISEDKIRIRQKEIKKLQRKDKLE